MTQAEAENPDTVEYELIDTIINRCTDAKRVLSTARLLGAIESAKFILQRDTIESFQKYVVLGMKP